MASLERIILRGYKSIRQADIELRPLNVLIGSNGAGKSNLVSFFKLLNEMMGERLQQFIASSGRAAAMLHFGPKVTPQLEARLEFRVENGRDTYHMRLFHAAGDTLVFAEENLSFLQEDWEGPPKMLNLGAGHQETGIRGRAEAGEPTAKVFRHLLSLCRVYHFHDTSSTSRVRQHCYVGDDRWLMPDAGNLAAVLYRLRESGGGSAYRRILSTVRLVAPFFDDFELEPTGPQKTDIILNWRERGSDQVFGPHQLSDGTLRAICLITLLLQPDEDLPYVIIVDEPELGLHPYALTTIASLFKRVSSRAQVIISTQSSSFLDSFDPEDIIVVDREEGGSTFLRLEAESLDTWLEDYSLGEVWGKERRRRGAALMARLYLFAEGQTEQTFADNVLSQHLARLGVYLQNAVLIAHARKKGKVHRGGGRKYLPMKNDILRFTSQEQGSDVYFTTMIDLYAIHSDFPGLEEAEGLRSDPYKRVEQLQASWADDIGDPRFVPFIQLHEFEAYLFTQPESLDLFYPEGGEADRDSAENGRNAQKSGVD